MKECPYCGKGFNWWQRAIGEYKEHLRSGCKLKAQKDAVTISTGCRGMNRTWIARFHWEKEESHHYITATESLIMII